MIRCLLLLIVFASPAVAQTWPQRLADPPGLLHEYDHPIADWFGITISQRTTGWIRDDVAAVTTLAASRGIETDTLEYEQRSAHIAAVREPRDGEEPDGFRYSVFVSVEPRAEGVARLHRTWFRFRSPDEPRGLAVLMPGMLGTPHQFIDRFERALLAEGWGVLRMLVPPSRSTEHLPVPIDPGAAEEPIRTIAVELDQRTAECAYAVEAGLAWAEAIEPELVGAPRTIVGMSGTGMMLPAVLARNEDAFRAAVVIGSGANAFKILRESDYADLLDAVRVTWTDGEPSDEELAKLDELYLRFAALDAHTLAPMVGKVPVLVIHGSADRAVPAEAGDLLWERLGKPERWATPVGHELLFVRTLLQIPQVIAWLNDRTAEAPS